MRNINGSVLRRKHADKLFIVFIIVAVAFSGALVSFDLHERVYPRHFQVGDVWVYKVVFPDAHGYQLTETVQGSMEINGTESYVIFSDDNQHISTNYLWLTQDWFEWKTYKPSIGNLQANSTVIFDPPAELFRIPFHVGDRWYINSNLTTSTSISNGTIVANSELHETRQTLEFDQIKTPAGDLKAFRISVVVSGSLYETMWFDPDLGQVVYAEFYNTIGERVTQTLIGYALMTPSARGIISAGVDLIDQSLVRRTLIGNIWEVIFTRHEHFSSS